MSESVYGPSDDYRESAAAIRVASKRRAARSRRKLRRLKLLGLVTVIVTVGFAGYSTFAAKTGARAKGNGETVRLPSSDRGVPRYLATVGGSGLKLFLPVDAADLTGIGFHEAENTRARPLEPSTSFLVDETTTTVRKAAKQRGVPVLFVMFTRYRGTDPKSAVDIAVRPNSVFKSPVSGVVSKIKEYYLYEQWLDYHVEITPDGYPDLRVAIIHIDKLTVSEGQRVEAGKTHVGVIRSLEGLETQVNEYLNKPSDHFHVQVNPASNDGAVAQ